MAAVQGFWLHCHLLLWIIFMALTSPVLPEMVYRVDPLGKFLLALSLLIYIYMICNKCNGKMVKPNGVLENIRFLCDKNTFGFLDIP